MWWYLLHGYRELGLSPNEDDMALSQAVNLPMPRLARFGYTPVTWLMREVHRRTGNSFAPLQTRDGQERFLAWFFAKALVDQRLGAFLTQAQADGLREAVSDRAGLPRIMAFIWEVDEGLRKRFEGLADPALMDWCRGEGARDFPILSHPLVAIAAPWQPPARAAGRRGVNLVGHAFDRSGLGEDVRAAALSLRAAGIPFVLHDSGSAGSIANDDASLSADVASDLPFDVTMFCFTGMSMVTSVLADAEFARRGRFSIGMWPWELPEWPSFWRHAYDHVDEIWAASRFTYDAYSRSAPVPVRHLPMAVVADASDGATRADFGLPADAFLFAFAFDGLSSIGRKNPAACIAAFRAAFPDRDRAVGLVIKGLRTDDAAWALLRAQAAGDDRIFFVTESLPRGRLLDLYRSVDALISLHRSEGFGRNIAEAMLLEKPVIVTGHSGNMDFTDHATAALVPARLVPLKDGDYPFGDGQTWAEPDVVTAARHMRRMVDDYEWQTNIARAGRRRIVELYAPDAVGQRWNDILRQRWR